MTEGASDDPVAVKKIVLGAVGDTGTVNVYSEYGSPYDCWINASSVKVTKSGAGPGVTVSMIGEGVRNRTKRTLAQQTKEKAAGSTKDMSAAETALGSGYEIRTSRFATSKCVTCAEAINPGERIAKRKSESAVRGGWSHVACVSSVHARPARTSGGDDGGASTWSRKRARSTTR